MVWKPPPLASAEGRPERPELGRAGSGSRPSVDPTMPALRQAAVVFTEGMRRGWGIDQLDRWATRHLVRPGWLRRLRNEHFADYHEPGAGWLRRGSGPPGRLPRNLPCLGPEDVPRIVGAAHARVIAALRGLLVHPVQDGFVHAALYAGCVLRRDGEWTVALDDSVALSDQVLALFAADLLQDREAYQRELAVCDTCGCVRFDADLAGRGGCLRHPDGVNSG